MKPNNEDEVEVEQDITLMWMETPATGPYVLIRADELASLQAWRARAVPLLRASQQALDAAIASICEECGIDRPLAASQYERMLDLERALRALLAESEGNDGADHL